MPATLSLVCPRYSTCMPGHIPSMPFVNRVLESTPRSAPQHPSGNRSKLWIGGTGKIKPVHLHPRAYATVEHVLYTTAFENEFYSTRAYSCTYLLLEPLQPRSCPLAKRVVTLRTRASLSWVLAPYALVHPTSSVRGSEAFVND